MRIASPPRPTSTCQCAPHALQRLNSTSAPAPWAMVVNEASNERASSCQISTTSPKSLHWQIERPPFCP